MADLYVSVDGQMVPLSACDWVFSHVCGHPFAVLLADLSGFASRPPVATEEQAWQAKYPRARDRQARQRTGVTVRLAVHAALDDEFWRQMKAGCECVKGVNRRG